MAKKKHRLLWAAGAAVAGYAAYRYVYRPWAAQRALEAAAGASPGGGGYSTGGFPMTYPSLPGAGSQPAPLPSVGSQLTDPAIIGFTSLGPQYGGVLGACIAKKGGTWSPQKCQDRLNALSQGYRAAAQMVLQLRGQSTNPNAPNVASINQLIDANVAGLANAQTGYAARMAAGDTEGAKVWAAAVAGHTADLNALRAQLAASPANANNTAAIAAYQGQMAANDTDYFNLTGVHLA